MWDLILIFCPGVPAPGFTTVKNGQFDADLLIGFKNIREKFTSRVTVIPGQSVDVDYLRGPLKTLYNHWRFSPSEGGTMIDFKVDFEFRNRALNLMIGGLFGKATQRMVAAFEARAGECLTKTVTQSDP